MTSPIVVEAFEQKIAAEWQGCPLLPENTVARAPKDASPFMVLQWPVVNRRQISFGSPGSNVFREEGAVRFVIAVRFGAGLGQGRIWAGDLVRMFLGATFAGIVIRAVDGPVTDDRNEDGNYYRLAVAVAYEFDIIA